jgi:hypothetical protein
MALLRYSPKDTEKTNETQIIIVGSSAQTLSLATEHSKLMATTFSY